jgi:type IV secretory pathway VirB2 component (pilin)
MASAERLLNEAQYAYNSVGPGNSRSDRRNASRAKSLARKIIRRYPTSTEAEEAHSLLRRLGDEAFLPQLPVVHRHANHDQSHRKPERSQAATPAVMRSRGASTSQAPGFEDTVSLDWAGLLSLLFATPKVVLGVIVAGLLFLFGIFGWLLFLPLVALVFLTSPARALLQRKQREDINAFVIQANAWIDQKIQQGQGFS